MTISLPLRKLRDLQERLDAWPATRETATVREVLVLARKLRHAAFVVRPGRYFVRRLLQLTMPHLNGDDGAGGGGVWGRHRTREEVKKVLRLTAEFMADVGWWRWYVQQEDIMEGRSPAHSHPPIYLESISSRRRNPSKGISSRKSSEYIRFSTSPSSCTCQTV